MGPASSFLLTNPLFLEEPQESSFNIPGGYIRNTVLQYLTPQTLHSPSLNADAQQYALAHFLRRSVRKEANTCIIDTSHPLSKFARQWLEYPRKYKRVIINIDPEMKMPNDAASNWLTALQGTTSLELVYRYPSISAQTIAWEEEKFILLCYCFFSNCSETLRDLTISAAIGDVKTTRNEFIWNNVNGHYKGKCIDRQLSSVGKCGPFKSLKKLTLNGATSMLRFVDAPELDSLNITYHPGLSKFGGLKVDERTEVTGRKLRKIQDALTILLTDTSKYVKRTKTLKEIHCRLFPPELDASYSPKTLYCVPAPRSLVSLLNCSSALSEVWNSNIGYWGGWSKITCLSLPLCLVPVQLFNPRDRIRTLRNLCILGSAASGSLDNRNSFVQATISVPQMTCETQKRRMEHLTQSIDMRNLIAVRTYDISWDVGEPFYSDLFGVRVPHLQHMTFSSECPVLISMLTKFLVSDRELPSICSITLGRLFYTNIQRLIKESKFGSRMYIMDPVFSSKNHFEMAVEYREFNEAAEEICRAPTDIILLEEKKLY